MGLDLREHLLGEPAGPEHQHVAQVVAALAQRPQRLLEQRTRAPDAGEGEDGEEDESAARITVLAEEVGDGDEEDPAERSGLEDAEDLVKGGALALGAVETDAPEAQWPEEAREQAYRERLPGRRDFRIREDVREAEAQRMGDRERPRHHQHVQEDPERGEDLMMPLEHGAPGKYRERTHRATCRSLDDDHLRHFELEALSFALPISDRASARSPRALRCRAAALPESAAAAAGCRPAGGRRSRRLAGRECD